MEDNSVYKKVVDSLCKGLREEPLPEIRIYIVKMLREIGNEDAILSLAIAIQDQNYHVRQAALEALRNSEIVKIGFLSYFKNFFNSQEISQEIIEEEAMLKHIGKTIFTFKKGDITMEKNPKVQQNLHGNIGNVVGNVEGNFEVKGNVFNYGSSSDQIAQELEKILDKIINKNLLAAQKQAQEAVSRLPELLKNPQAIELAVSSNRTLKQKFQSAIIATNIETVKLIFAPAGIPIEGFKA